MATLVRAQAPAITTENAADLTLVQTLAGHDLPINDLAFLPDGRLISASDDITARLWDVESGETEWALDGQLIQVRSVDVSPDGETALTTGFNNSAFLWDIRSRTRATSITALAAFNDGVFAPDGESFALAVGDGTVRLYERDAETATLTIEADALRVTALSYSPDGTRIVGGHGFPSDRVLVWDTEMGDTRLSLEGHTGTVYGVANHPDGALILSGGGDGQVILWDADTGETVYRIEDAHDSAVYDVAFSPAGDVFASVGFDGVLRLWDAETGESLAAYTPDDENRSLLALAFSPDGVQVATAGEAAAVYVWQVP